MKTIIATLVLLTSFTFAQKRQMKGEKLTPEQQTELRLKKMTSALDLTEKQQNEIKPILFEHAKKREEKRTQLSEIKASGEKLSNEEKLEMKDNMLAERDAMEQKLEKILSAEQMEKWKNNKEEQKEKLKKRIDKKKTKKANE